MAAVATDFVSNNLPLILGVGALLAGGVFLETEAASSAAAADAAEKSRKADEARAQQRDLIAQSKQESSTAQLADLLADNVLGDAKPTEAIKHDRIQVTIDYTTQISSFGFAQAGKRILTYPYPKTKQDLDAFIVATYAAYDGLNQVYSRLLAMSDYANRLANAGDKWMNRANQVKLDRFSSDEGRQDDTLSGTREIINQVTKFWQNVHDRFMRDNVISTLTTLQAFRNFQADRGLELNVVNPNTLEWATSVVDLSAGNLNQLKATNHSSLFNKVVPDINDEYFGLWNIKANQPAVAFNLGLAQSPDTPSGTGAPLGIGEDSTTYMSNFNPLQQRIANVSSPGGTTFKGPFDTSRMTMSDISIMADYRALMEWSSPNIDKLMNYWTRDAALNLQRAVGLRFHHGTVGMFFGLVL